MLNAPRNLIHAQQGGGLANQSSDPEQYPNLNSGDFFAYWLVDGLYRNLGTYNQLPQAAIKNVLNLPFGLWAGLYPRPVDAVTALLMKSDAINEWALNDNTGAQSALVLTAPTKRFYTDWANLDTPHLDLLSPILGNIYNSFPAGIPPFSQQFGPSGFSCDPVGVAFWNNDEVGPENPVFPSPTPSVDLCWETNVVYTA